MTARKKTDADRKALKAYLADNITLLSLVILFLVAVSVVKYLWFGTFMNPEQLFDNTVVGIIAGLTSALAAKWLFEEKKK